MTNVLDAVLGAVDDVNRQLPPDGRIDRRADAVLCGPDGVLDSLGLVNLVIAVEYRVGGQTGIEVVLTDDWTLAHADTVMATVATLAQYVERRLREKVGA